MSASNDSKNPGTKTLCLHLQIYISLYWAGKQTISCWRHTLGALFLCLIKNLDSVIHSSLFTSVKSAKEFWFLYNSDEKVYVQTITIFSPTDGSWYNTLLGWKKSVITIHSFKKKISSVAQHYTVYRLLFLCPTYSYMKHTKTMKEEICCFFNTFLLSLRSYHWHTVGLCYVL